MKTNKVTVKEIARLAGVSIGTIDRVLHDRGGVSSETKQRIEGIISSHGFEPNLLARQLSLNKTYAFRVVLPRSDQDSGYWALCLAGILRAGRDLEPYGTRLEIEEFDRYDEEAYRALLADIVAEPLDGLVLAPILPTGLLAALGELGPSGEGGAGGWTPYVFLDSDLPGASPVAAIGQDSYKGGYLAGRMMSLLAQGPGPLAAVSAHAGDIHIRKRIEGFENFFRLASSASGAPARAIEVIECPEIENESDCERFLGPRVLGREGLSGILVANASGHLVGDWLLARGARPGCALVSWDLVPANARALREGSIDCVVSQRPQAQGREAVERLFKAVVRGESDASPASIPLEVYFKENIPDQEAP
jgi:LacI family transcriptional regulator